MLLLAVDTSTRFSGIALLRDTTVMAEYLLQSQLTHSQRLLPAIDLILQDALVKVEDLQGLVVAQGPGSFTGLRIGISLVKGLAQALEIPLVGISSLQSWAYAVGYTLPQGSVVVTLLDAGRSEYYCGVFQKVDEGVSQLQPEGAVSLPQLREMLQSYSQIPVFLAGDLALTQQVQLLAELPDNCSWVAEKDNLPRPAALALLGGDSLRRGVYSSWRSLVPSYYRLAEAERKRLGLG
ncbi:MAG: tRNA (adenosine(37)-N6)-threonylcarbamoyltransferase complex dimerization subunit type 1 TsaB [Symbiobacteriaceae bacterium]|nr:tRNA (adenosine(37)-N6)-threonylcarbamoyltransferase complex dimerization subunit type 1 TsaB [Symbiobacteriaceae bacterium]